MFRLFSDYGLGLYAYDINGLIATLRMGSITWTLYPWCAHCWLVVRFFCGILRTGMDVFCYPLGVPYMGQLSSVLTLLISFPMITCSYFILLCYTFLLCFGLLQALTIVKSTSWSRSSSFRCLLRGHPGHRKTIWGSLTDGQSSLRSVGHSVFPFGPMDCALYLRFLLQSPKTAPAFKFAFYAFKWLHQVVGMDSPTLHPTVITAKEGALLLLSQPASHRK